MHLRRALLLFAIVLGLAAVAASLAPPPEESADQPAGDADPPAETADPPPETGRPPAGGTPPPGEAAGTAPELRFVTGAEEPERRTITAGEHAVVTVAVDDAGEVAIEGLGLLQAAAPGTLVRFDVLPRPGRYEITFRPVRGEPERVGIIEVEPA